jgi:hypothetical protein
VNEFQRLLTYARPYRGRIAIALVAMVMYAAGPLPGAPIADFQQGAERQDVGKVGVLILAPPAWAGAYVSGFLMADVGSASRDCGTSSANLDQSAAFARRTSGQSSRSRTMSIRCRTSSPKPLRIDP